VVKYLPKGEQGAMRRKLQRAYEKPTYAGAKAALNTIRGIAAAQFVSRSEPERRLGTEGDTLTTAWNYIEKNRGLLTTMPDECDFQAGQGFSFTTLRVAVWAAEWALKGEPYSGVIPEPLPKEPFRETGARTLYNRA